MGRVFAGGNISRTDALWRTTEVVAAGANIEYLDRTCFGKRTEQAYDLAKPVCVRGQKEASLLSE